MIVVDSELETDKQDALGARDAAHNLKELRT